jgi:hypothetical protein
VGGVRLNGNRLATRQPDDPGAALAVMLRTLLPGVDTGTLEKAIRADLEEQLMSGNATTRTLGARAVGLALGSPEFQRR